MTPDAWDTIKRIFADALELAPEAREAFVAQACDSDPAVLGEVRRLLAENDAAGASFLKSGSVGRAWPASPGNRDVPYLDTVLAGRYRIERELGRGGNSIVFLASDLQVHAKAVVIKVLQDHAEHSEWLTAKFRHEMEALARIRHPGVVAALDIGELPDGRPFLVMEYVDGATLRSEIRPEGLEFGSVMELVSQIARALDAAHEMGVLHRDLKPENVMLVRSDTDAINVKLIDFGIAKVEEPEQAYVTNTVILAGTTSYMAPEQLMGAATASSDTYALAVTAYELLTGKRPFYPATPVQLFQLQKEGSIPDPSGIRQEIPKAAARVVVKALSFRPVHRPASAVDFASGLAKALTQPATTREVRRRRSAVAAILVAVTATALVGTGWRNKEALLRLLRGNDSIERVIMHEGASDPRKAGFLTRGEFTDRWELNAQANGFDGMRFFSKWQGYYHHELTMAQKRAAVAKGWRLSLRAHAIEGMTFGVVDLVPLHKRFDIMLVVNAAGGHQVMLATQAKPSIEGLRTDVHGRPEADHLYELVAQPGSKSAHLLVDGKLTLTNYNGHTDYQEDRGALFGVARYQSAKAEGVVRMAKFEINP